MKIFPHLALFVLCSVFAVDALSAEVETEDTALSKLMVQSKLEEEGRLLAKQGLYDEAIAKYKEALKPENWTYEWETGTARHSIHDLLKLKGDYQSAFEALQGHLEKNPDKYEPERRELLALMEYARTKNPNIIHDHIDYLKKINPKFMPPAGHSATIMVYISDIIRLNDTIGDYDAGIAFIDANLSFLKMNQKQFGENPATYDRIKTSQEALACSELDKKRRQRNPEWRSCNIIREYLLVREAFEKDKAEGTRGRATLALIQSDYFPW